MRRRIRTLTTSAPLNERTCPPRREARPARNGGKLATVRQWWAERNRHSKHWMVNILVGCVIELALVLTHHSAILSQAQDLALDRIMRVNAVLDPPSRAAVPPPQQTFVDIDEETWRSEAWGGGEPYRAPRAGMLELIAKAFGQGASQVVLDIAVEGSAIRANDRADDAFFAAGIKRLLDDNVIGPHQLLILVRGLRGPLQGASATQIDDSDGREVSPYLHEMRAAPEIDSLLEQGDPRLALAAPYFAYSRDRVLREWELFSVVCARRGAAADGVVRVLPSVQMVVNASRILKHNVDLPWRRASDRAVQLGCKPFPSHSNEIASAPQARVANRDAERKATSAFWRVASALPAGGIRRGENAPSQGTPGNRLVYRSVYPFASDDGYFEHMRAPVLLASTGSGALKDRVVIIGQSYSDAGDTHFTPLGTMPGAVVLMNAIDSMSRYGLIDTPSAWITMPFVILSIVLVGYVYARWNSSIGTLISTVLILLLYAGASVYFFRSGLWLDFALPLLGIQGHRMIKTVEEYLGKRSAAIAASWKAGP